jgi:hypothetical protein
VQASPEQVCTGELQLAPKSRLSATTNGDVRRTTNMSDLESVDPAMSSMRPRGVARLHCNRAVTVACLLGAALMGSGCEKPSPPPAPAPAPVAVLPHLTGVRSSEPMVLDGKLDDEAWKRGESSPTFVDVDGRHPVVPHTEARAAFTAQALWVGIYAADEDLISDDAVGFTAFAGTTRQTRWSLNPAGALSCGGALCSADAGEARVRGLVDADGTLDARADDDEEWAAELELPWPVLGLKPGGLLPVTFFRRDRLKDGTALELVWPRGSQALVKTVDRARAGPR